LVVGIVTQSKKIELVHKVWLLKEKRYKIAKMLINSSFQVFTTIFIAT